ncbi:MAG: polysaccharide biosynthesis tyrosine autokinase [Pseudomonadota bacterium]|nr:polysaccharide biosynthesis tyrosine autokinase [Pseudomonadota bacterium]MEC8525338.1 polysaccharide biosynthesis tyrosine autokinase [Pseudomonadota bacterium]
MSINQGPNPFAMSDESQPVDFSRYLGLIRRYLFRVIGFALAVAVIAALIALSLTSRYQATATLLIEEQSAQVIQIEEVYGIPGNSRNYLSTQFEILKSRELARRVVKELMLVDSPEFNPFHPKNTEKFSIRRSIREQIFGKAPEAGEEYILEKTIDRFWSAVNISPVPGTQLVKITVTSVNSDVAKRAANRLAEGFIESQLEAKIGLTQQAAGWLTERLTDLKDKLEVSERKLQTYRDENNLVDVSGVGTVVSREIDNASAQLGQARAKRVELESTYRQLKKFGTYTYDNLSSIPTILNNQVIGSLKSQETRAELSVSELGKRYGPRHPKMVAAQSDLDAVRASLLTQMKRVASTIESDYLAALNKERTLENTLSSARESAREINRKEFTLKEIEREVETNRALYTTFYERMSETSATGDLQTANARVIDPAVRPDRPTSPNRKLIVLVAFFAGIMLGIGVILLRDFLDSKIKNAEDVDRKLKTPMLALLPLLKLGKKTDDEAAAEAARAFNDDEQVAFAESVRTLRTSISLAGLEHPSQVILMTSSTPGEGKTTTACNIAEAFGQLEKVLLIDADMRRPTMAKKLGLEPGKPGLSNAVAYPETLEDCIQSVEGLNIDVMAAGPIPPNPLELLASKKFRDILDTLRGQYQRIIIDSAPVLAVSDALYLSTVTDGVVYVVKADATRDKLAVAGLDRLRGSNARIMGVVLNQVDVEKEAKYGGSYAGYYDTYGYSTQS